MEKNVHVYNKRVLPIQKQKDKKMIIKKLAVNPQQFKNATNNLVRHDNCFMIHDTVPRYPISFITQDIFTAG